MITRSTGTRLAALLFFFVALLFAYADSNLSFASDTDVFKDAKKNVYDSIKLLEQENKAFYEALGVIENLAKDPNAKPEDARGALRSYFKASEQKTLTALQAVGSLLDFQRALVEDWENISPKEFKSFISWGSKRNEKTQEEVRSLTEKQNLAIEKAIAIALKDLTPAASPVTTTP